MTTRISRMVEGLRNLFAGEMVDVAKVFGGTLSRNLIRGIFKLLLAGFLAPHALGILYAVYSLFKIAAGLAEFGLDYALITFAGAAAETRERRGVLKTIFILKVIIWLGFLIFGNLFAEKIAQWALGDADLAIYIRFLFLGIGGQMLWKFISGYLSVHRQFGKIALFFGTLPLLMLFAMIIAVSFNRFDLRAGILIYLFAPVVTAVIWWPVLDRKFIRHSGWNKGLVNTLFRFSRWIYLTNIVSSVRNHINPLLLKNPGLSGSISAGEVNTGLYSFGNDLANEIGVVAESLFTVWLPKASRRANTQQMRRFVVRAYGTLAILMIPLVLAMFMVKPMLYLLAYFRADYLAYLPSIQIFNILYMGVLLSLAALPMTTVLYALKMPHIETAVELLTIVVLVCSSIFLIPRYGGQGAAVAVFIQRAVSFFVVFSYGFLKLRKRNTEID